MYLTPSLKLEAVCWLLSESGRPRGCAAGLKVNRTKHRRTEAADIDRQIPRSTTVSVSSRRQIVLTPAHVAKDAAGRCYAAILSLVDQNRKRAGGAVLGEVRCLGG